MILEEYVVTMLYNVLVYLHDYVAQLHDLHLSGAPSFADFRDESNLKRAFVDCTKQKIFQIRCMQDQYTITYFFTSYRLSSPCFVISLIDVLCAISFNGSLYNHSYGC